MSTRVKRNRAGAMAVGGIGALALGALIYFGNVVPNTRIKNFGVVDEGRLYRSAALTPAATRRVVERYGVKTIIDLGGFDKDPVGERVAARTAAALGVERVVFPLHGDGTGNPNAYVGALRLISDPSKQPVLVHCSAGAQRTSGCIMLYREMAQGTSLEASYPEASRYRHDPEKNPYLLPYLQRWHGRIEEAVRAGRLIEGQPGPEAGPEEAGATGANAGDR